MCELLDWQPVLVWSVICFAAGGLVAISWPKGD